MPGAGRVELQGEVLGEAQHGGIRMGVVVERIAPGRSAERPESMRELLVARLIDALVGLFGDRLFGLALTAVRGLVPRGGIGIVAVLHRPTTVTASPATLQLSI